MAHYNRPTADLRQNAAPHIVAMYQLDTSTWPTTSASARVVRTS